MSKVMKTSNPMTEASEALGRRFRVIGMKYNSSDGENKRDDLVVVSNDDPPVEDVNGEHVDIDVTAEFIAKIAAKNDGFRQCDLTKNTEFKGTWLYDDGVKALTPTTKAAIKKKIREFPLDQFEECPLHDFGNFNHTTKNEVLNVHWQIEIFGDESKLTKPEYTEGDKSDYRVLTVSLGGT